MQYKDQAMRYSDLRVPQNEMYVYLKLMGIYESEHTLLIGLGHLDLAGKTKKEIVNITQK